MSPEYNANWRIDGLGDKGPDSAHRFNVPKESFVNFLFESSTTGASAGLLPGQSSNYFFLDTTATLYAKTATYDLTGTGNGAISDQFAAFTPTTVPEPTALLLLVVGGRIGAHGRQGIRTPRIVTTFPVVSERGHAASLFVA